MEVTQNTYCLVIDIISSTNRLLDISTAARNSFNLALTKILPPFLSKLGLDNSNLKFTGDGFVVTIENSTNLTHLLCFALLLRNKFHYSIIEISGIPFTTQWDLRLGIANGQDVKLEFNNQIEYVGDSIRRATRISTLCNTNEILVDFPIYRDTSRDFIFEEINIEQRISNLGVKKFEHDIGNLVYSIKEVKYSSLKNADVILVYFDEIGYHKGKEEIVAEVKTKIELNELTKDEVEAIDKASIALSSIGRYQTGNEIYKRLKHRGYSRSLIYWNRLLKLSNDFNTANIILRQIINAGLKPDGFSYTTLMNKVADFEQAKEVLREMKAENINPNEVTYTTLMNKVVDFEQAKEVLREMKNYNIIPNLLTYSSLFKKDIANYTAREVHLWYVKEEKFHPAGPIEGLIKNLFYKKRFNDVYYLTLHYPYLTISKKIVKENFITAISMYEAFRNEDFYASHIDYALGIAYYEQQKNSKARKYLKNALLKTTIANQKKDIERLLILIENY